MKCIVLNAFSTISTNVPLSQHQCLCVVCTKESTEFVHSRRWFSSSSFSFRLLTIDIWLFRLQLCIYMCVETISLARFRPNIFDFPYFQIDKGLCKLCHWSKYLLLYTAHWDSLETSMNLCVEKCKIVQMNISFFRKCHHNLNAFSLGFFLEMKFQNSLTQKPLQYSMQAFDVHSLS